MGDFTRLILSFVLGFILVAITMPKMIPLFHKLKFGQVEREEGLESHKKKGGTPTMGGAVFIVATVIAALVVNYKYLTSSTLWLITLMLVGYGAIGLLDDSLIVIQHSNKGLSPKAKYALQSVLAILFYVLAVNLLSGFNTIVTIPVIDVGFDFKIIYFFLIYFMFTATSNGVNLSDGLDGLATGLSMIAIAPYVIFAIMLKDYVTASYATAMIGALLGFMIFNYHPAKIFMGDVGSLALGGFLATLAIITKQELLLVVIGAVFVMETLSVILQVASFKTRGKRIFKMAPIHHHFEMCGWTETQVVITFWFVGFIAGILGIVLGVL